MYKEVKKNVSSIPICTVSSVKRNHITESMVIAFHCLVSPEHARQHIINGVVFKRKVRYMLFSFIHLFINICASLGPIYLLTDRLKFFQSEGLPRTL